MENETTVAVIETGIVVPEDQEQALTKTVTEIEFKAESIIIDTDEDYQQAAEFGRLLKQRAAEVKEFWKPMKEAAHKAHTEICDKEKAMLQPLTNAEKILKLTMGTYVAEQEKKRKEAEEAARKAAQEEADRKMEEAIALEAKGDKVAAEAAIEEADIMDQQSQQVSIPQQKPKAAGVSTKKDWKITAVDGAKVPTHINGVEIRPVDTAAVMRLIRASKGTIEIPGIKYEENVQMSFRR